MDTGDPRNSPTEVLAEADHLFLPAVITSIEECIDTSNPEVADTWNEIRKMVAKLRDSGSFEYNVNGTNVSVHKLALDELYGTLLHGDWERWQRGKRDGGLTDLALFDWVIQAETLVVGVQGFWELAVRDGLVIEE